MATAATFAPMTSLLAGGLLLLSGCLGGGDGSTVGAQTVAPPVSTPTTTTLPEPVPPPPLTHREFVRRVDSICRKFNDKLDRRYGDASDAAVEAQDLDRLADLYVKSRSLNAPFYDGLRRLRSRGVPERDRDGFRKYVALTRQLDNLEVRYTHTLRQSDFDEMARLDDLKQSIRNKRTRVTSAMGLRECGS